MSFSDFDYFLTPYDSIRLNQGYYYAGGDSYTKIETFGDNGEPYMLSDEPDKFVRKYQHSFKAVMPGSSFDFDYSNSRLLMEKNYIKNDILQQHNLLDENGKIVRDKMISVRMKLNITENKRNQLSTDSTSQIGYYRYFAGITLFGSNPPNIFDYQVDDQGNTYNVEKFSYSTVTTGGSYVITKPDNFPSYTGMGKILSGYNLLLSSDGRGVRGWTSYVDSINPNYAYWGDAYDASRHLSLYGYGVNTNLIDIFVSDDTLRAIGGQSSDNFKLYECNNLINEQEYSLQTWYNIRLDYIPITDTSHKLISYAAKDGDLTWTRTGEVIHHESEDKYVNDGRIGFVVGTFVGNLRGVAHSTDGLYDPESNKTFNTIYRLDTTTYVENFNIYVEDIPTT